MAQHPPTRPAATDSQRHPPPPQHQRVKTYSTFNGKAVALRDSTDTTNYPAYIHGDHLGSVSVVTNSTGGTVSQEFDPWGKVRSGGTSATKRNFTGQYLDDTGLLFYNARYYDPAIGRFLSADTVVPNPGNPQDFNRYAYVNNNPVNRTDPTGHWPYDDPLKCYCGYYGAARAAATSGGALRTPLNVAAPTFIAAGAAAGTAVGSIDTESGSRASPANSDQMGGRTAPNPSAPTPPAKGEYQNLNPKASADEIRIGRLLQRSLSEEVQGAPESPLGRSGDYRFISSNGTARSGDLYQPRTDNTSNIYSAIEAKSNQADIIVVEFGAGRSGSLGLSDAQAIAKDIFQAESNSIQRLIFVKNNNIILDIATP